MLSTLILGFHSTAAQKVLIEVMFLKSQNTGLVDEVLLRSFYLSLTLKNLKMRFH